jgi:hypothetical protein
MTFRDEDSLLRSGNGHNGSPCSHSTHRTVRLFMPYADANSVRLRFAAEASARVTVSLLKRIPGGYAFESCAGCMLDRSASA